MHTAPSSLKMAELHSGSFCYFKDFLNNRLGEFKNLRKLGKLQDTWLATYNGNAFSLINRLCHPDITKPNIVLEDGTNMLYIVDNELLSVGIGWILDWHNSFLYNENLTSPDYVKEVPKKLIEQAWLYRRICSATENNNLSKLNDLINVIN